jgi:adenylate cyclase
VSLEPFIEAGLFDPTAANAAERRELIEHLLGRGFSGNRLVEVGTRIAEMTNLAVAMERPLPPRLSLGDLARHCGATTDEVAALRAALGFTVATEDVVDVPSTFVDDFALYRLACDQYGRERALAFARVLGASVITITEAARELFTSPLRETSATELQISEANEIGMAAWDSLPGLIAHLMVERTSRDLWFEAELLKGDLTMAVAFVDLVGSTAWELETSAPDHAAALSRFELTAARLASARGARVVKFIGDEAMIVTHDPAAATAIATELCRAAADDPALPSARAAVGFGAVTARDGDYFGSVVNLTSRATKVAGPETVLVTTDVARHLDPQSWSVSEARPVSLRGVSAPVELVEVKPERRPL